MRDLTEGTGRGAKCSFDILVEWGLFNARGFIFARPRNPIIKKRDPLFYHLNKHMIVARKLD